MDLTKKHIYFLSGLSESGKSQAGIWATEAGIFRLKIIYFEKMIGQLKGLQMRTKAETETTLEILYQNEYEMIETFKNYIYDFMVANKCEAISLESLYRAELAIGFLNDPRFETEVIYLEAPIEKRAEREFVKIQQTQLNQDSSLTSILKQTEVKDDFKIAKGVLKVKAIATQIINNDRSLSKFKKQILEIFQKRLTN